MFAFMVISTYIQRSGLYRVLLRPVLFIFRRLIKADDSIISIFLLSLIGGYPIGVKLLSENDSRGSYNTPENAAAFCYCISPTFAVIMLGSGVLGSTTAGVIIYISNVLACLTVALMVSRMTDLRLEPSPAEKEEGLTDAINSASRSLLVICTVIIAFNTVLSGITSLLSKFGIGTDPFIAGIFEISNLLKLRSVSMNIIPFIAAISSFGGICVLLQCLAIVKNTFSAKKFLIARIPCAILSGAYSYIILRFTDISVTASTISPVFIYSFSSNKIIVPILIAMCIIIFYRSDKNPKKV